MNILRNSIIGLSFLCTCIYVPSNAIQLEKNKKQKPPSNAQLIKENEQLRIKLKALRIFPHAFGYWSIKVKEIKTEFKTNITEKYGSHTEQLKYQLEAVQKQKETLESEIKNLGYQFVEAFKQTKQNVAKDLNKKITLQSKLRNKKSELKIVTKENSLLKHERFEADSKLQLLTTNVKETILLLKKDNQELRTIANEYKQLAIVLQKRAEEAEKKLELFN